MRETNQIRFKYMYQQPARYTFEQPKLKKWVEKWCKGKVLNLFAGKTKLLADEVRVDMDKSTNPNFCQDSYEFVEKTNMKFDTVVLDPPYNVRKSREKYNGRYIGSFTKIKNKLQRILNDGAIIITLGYDTVGMGRNRNFKKIAICLVCHGGDHNDTLGLVEIMDSKRLIH